MTSRLRLAPMAARPLLPRVTRLPRRTIRLRLTLIYGGLFLLCGAALLAVTYLLVRFTFPAASTRTYLHTPPGAAGHPGTPPPSPAAPEAPAARQRNADLHQLLVVSGFALAAMVLVALGLGWVVAGRVLRPLRTITAAARDLSSATLSRRLALPGPDDELKELADTFDGLIDRLERSFTAQRQFVANASHELRTPLTLERALLDAALRDPGRTAAAFRQTCERLVAVNAGQERLLEALLTLASSERGLDHREPLDLAELAAGVIAARSADAGNRGLTVMADLRPASAAGDPNLTERLIANLVDNALRYNTPGGRIEVTTATEAGPAVLRVSNTGPEIPPDRSTELFQPFRRLASSRTHRPAGAAGRAGAAGDGATGREGHDGGHGLGLSIVAAIATAHDAALSAEPGPAGGLTVTVRWPLPPSA